MDLEATFFSVVFGVALWPLVAGLVFRSGRLAGLVIGLLWISASIGAAWVASGWRQPALPESAVRERPIEMPGDGYVSSDNCRSCHPAEYHSWHASYHRTMTQVPTRENVRGDFEDKVVEVYGHRYLLQRRGDEFWVELDYISPLHRQQNHYTRVWRKIVLVTGSHRMQIYWMATGDTRRLEMLPIVYLYEVERWVPRTSVFLMRDTTDYHGEVGRWNEGCIDCHTTRGRSEKYDEFDMDTRAAEFGIACEACHGPGHTHVTANRQFVRRYRLAANDQPDPTIFHPRTVSAARSSQMCGRCHAASRISRRDYTPDQDLADFRTPIHKGDPEVWNAALEKFGPFFMENTFWPDGMLRVSGREYNGLVETPCYQHGDESRGVLSCLSCHAMHRRDDDPRPMAEWTDDQLKPGMRSNAACVQCHGEFRDERKLAGHTHHAPASSGSLCYNCHMPFTTYGLLKAMRSHTISSPNVTESAKAGRPNACNLCHLDRPLGWTARHLADWFGIESPELTEEQRTVAASVDWLLRGDAGQRALLAWGMGWRPAREVSGSDWMTPHLLRLLDDPYDAVRFIARRTLRQQPGFADFEYDLVGTPEYRREAVNRAFLLWEELARTTSLKGKVAVLFDEEGRLMKEPADRMWAERDDRPVHLLE